MWKQQLLNLHGQSPLPSLATPAPTDLLSRLYLATPETPTHFNFPTMHRHMISTHVCNTITLLSIIKNSRHGSRSYLATLPLHSIEQCLQVLVNDVIIPSSPPAQGPSLSLGSSSLDLDIRVDAFIQGVAKCPITRAACLCDCVFMYHQLECSIARQPCITFQFDGTLSTQQHSGTASVEMLFNTWRVTREHLNHLDLELMWELSFTQVDKFKIPSAMQPPDLASLATLISTNKYPEALREMCDNKNLRCELVVCIPLLLGKINNSEKHFQHRSTWRWDDEDILLGRLQCTLKAIQIVFEHPVCLKALLEVDERGVAVAKDAQLALVNLTLHVGSFIREYFGQKAKAGPVHRISSKQPQYVQYWFQILALLCAHSHLFYRSDYYDPNFQKAWSDPSNISFAALKLVDLIEACATPLVAIAGDNGDGPDSDTKKCMMTHLGAASSQLVDNTFSREHSLSSRGPLSGDVTCSTSTADLTKSVGSNSTSCSEAQPKSALSQEAKQSMSRVILRELGRLAPHPLTKGSSYLAQAEELQHILVELMEMERDESKEVDARARMLRRVCAWNVSPDPRGCSVYCTCLGLMLFGQESSAHVFAPLDARRNALKRLKGLLDALDKQSPDDHGNNVAQMFVSELAVLVCLSSCAHDLDPSRRNLDTSALFGPADDCDDERRTLFSICTQLCPSVRRHYTKRYHAAAAALQAKPGLEKARQVIVSMFGDKADGQLMNGFGKGQRRLVIECGEAQLHGDGACKRKGEWFLRIGDAGWIDQDAFLVAWNEKLRVQLQKNLATFLYTLKQQNDSIFDALINAAKRAGILEVAHLRALADGGALEPGHEQCKWIREAYADATVIREVYDDTTIKLRLGMR